MAKYPHWTRRYPDELVAQYNTLLETVRNAGRGRRGIWTAVANEIGLSLATVSLVVTGRRFSPPDLVRITNALNDLGILDIRAELNLDIIAITGGQDDVGSHTDSTQNVGQPRGQL